MVGKQLAARFVKRSSALGVTGFAILAACATTADAASATPFPPPASDATVVAGASLKTLDSVVFAGGCFWGIQAVFQHVKGVVKATSGYSGGSVKSPSYEDVSSGTTGHAESVKVLYDPSVVTYGNLLKVFFSVAHDPTELNRQGPDDGTQYRSAVFFYSPEQKKTTDDYVIQLTAAKTFAHPIVTQVKAFTSFYPAEDYHQDFAIKNPNYPYIVINDAPKVVHLQKAFPDLYSDKPAKS